MIPRGIKNDDIVILQNFDVKKSINILYDIATLPEPEHTTSKLSIFLTLYL